MIKEILAKTDGGGLLVFVFAVCGTVLLSLILIHEHEIEKAHVEKGHFEVSQLGTINKVWSDVPQRLELNKGECNE